CPGVLEGPPPLIQPAPTDTQTEKANRHKLCINLVTDFEHKRRQRTSKNKSTTQIKSLDKLETARTSPRLMARTPF
ncbi:AAEL008927-PA, partial [Aedes aegypti]